MYKRQPPTSDPALTSVALQANLRDVAPFDASQFSDETLLEACRDCEGNHLSFPIPPIEMIEHMLQHPEQRPIRQLLPACLSCLSTVTDELRALRDRLLQEPAIARFPQLQLRMREEMDGLFAMRQAESEKKLRELVEMEEVNDGTRLGRSRLVQFSGATAHPFLTPYHYRRTSRRTTRRSSPSSPPS